MSRSHVRSESRLELVGGRSSAKLPQYMFKRGDTFYFKRRIPADAAEAFPDFAGQVWRSLETSLLSKARVRLAVEVTEFNLTVAAHRRQKAAEQGAKERPIQSKPALACSALGDVEPLVAPSQIAPLDALIKHADQAMYQAKKNQTGYAFFDEGAVGQEEHQSTP